MNNTIGDEVKKLYSKELSGRAVKNPRPASGMLTVVFVNSVLLLIGLTIIIFIHYFNKFVVLQQEIYAAGSSIEKEYQRRSSLVPNLIGVAKEYAEYEREITRFVADIRALKMISGKTEIRQVSKKNPEIEKALSKLVALAEQYPNLKATENFQVLMEKAETSEDRIASARAIYVSRLNDYTTPMQTFPDNMFAAILGFKQFLPYKPEDDPKPLRIERIRFESRWWDWMNLVRSIRGAPKNQGNEDSGGDR